MQASERDPEPTVAPPPPATAAPARSDLRGAARLVALLGITGALVPWLAVAGLFAFGLYYELLWSSWVAMYAVAALGGQVWVLIFAAIVMVGVTALGTALFHCGAALLVSAKIFAAAWTGALSGTADLTVLRLAMLANGATCVVWGALHSLLDAPELSTPTLVLALVSALAAGLSGAAVLLAKRQGVTA